ncbi:hypothetical protein CVT24_001625 [Panaeolus cyanescens]|uniref:Uncharacterized protein n=1 Tax=Panaeolus cyanescens TaxID=181874 RepID=A0A409YF50_9AGAR|nr:hypothetical protein CVT24_001625 [Panaeolus cyanescens]
MDRGRTSNRSQPSEPRRSRSLSPMSSAALNRREQKHKSEKYLKLASNGPSLRSTSMTGSKSSRGSPSNSAPSHKDQTRPTTSLAIDVPEKYRLNPGEPIDNTVYAHILAFLFYTPDPYRLATNASKSASTKGFSPYDLHIHREQQLNTIVKDGMLATALFEVPMKLLDRHSFRLQNEDITQHPDLTFRRYECPPLVDENQLLEIFTGLSMQPTSHQKNSKLKSRSTYPGVAAPPKSTNSLMLHATDIASVLISGDLKAVGKKSILSLSRSANRVAIEDMNVSLVSPLRVQWMRELNSIISHPNTAASIRILVVYEFKSLVTGSKDVMEGIVGAPVRSWEECDACTEYLRTGERGHCDAPGDFQDMWLEGGKMGYDAPDGFLSSITDKEMICSDASHVLPLPSRSRDGDDDLRHKAGSWDLIRQQFRAELVKNDSTYGMIVSGNHLIIGHRHRGDNGKKPQLTFSDVIDIENPAVDFGGILVSVIVSAFFDAMARAKRIAYCAGRKTAWTAISQTDGR